MSLDVLEFEKAIVELDEKISELNKLPEENKAKFAKELASLEKRRDQKLKEVFSNLKPTQVVQLARHPKRPHAIDYIRAIFTDFDELHGDRHFADDPAIIAGVAKFNGEPVAVIGQERGRNTKEKIYRNFAMPKPEGYRKALRVMQLAEKFSLPILTFIDTPGAYPGIGAEERNQSEAIAKNLLVMSELKTPIIATVIGEGGSGGALALGVGDHIMMLQYSIYSVISPEGCASILWRSADKAAEAADALKLTAQDSLNNKLIDEIVQEPLGGAHRSYEDMYQAIRNSLDTNLRKLKKFDIEQLLATRYAKLMTYGLSKGDS